MAVADVRLTVLGLLGVDEGEADGHDDEDGGEELHVDEDVVVGGLKVGVQKQVLIIVSMVGM